MSQLSRAAALIERAAQAVPSLTAILDVADAHYEETRQTVVVPTGDRFQIAPQYNPNQRITGFRLPRAGDPLGTIFGGTPLEYDSVEDAQAAIEQGRLAYAGVMSESKKPATYAQFLARHRGILTNVEDEEKAADNLTQRMLLSLGFRKSGEWQHLSTEAAIEIQNIGWNGDSPTVWLVCSYAKGRIKRGFQMHIEDDIEDMYNLLAAAASN